MRDALKNIFDKKAAPTKHCTVTARLARPRYQLTDAVGRTIVAESTDFYPPGARVVVQGGRIVGRGALAGTHRSYDISQVT